jgi:GTP-sensing pleiotropic transcriptional regulator CodY
MSLNEISKRVHKAVKEVGVAERNKKLSYDDLAKKIGEIALNNGLTVAYVRRVSGVEFTPISNLIKYHEIGSTKQFEDNYKKLSNTDKARVDLAISELEQV